MRSWTDSKNSSSSGLEGCDPRWEWEWDSKNLDYWESTGLPDRFLLFFLLSIDLTEKYSEKNEFGSIS